MRIRKIYITTVIICLPVILIMCRKPGAFSEADYDPRLSGGAATAFDETAGAFGHEMPGLNANDSYVHGLGDGAVEQSFVTAPAPVNSGLGPIFSNVSCVSCHHNDGKGSPTAGLVNSSLLMRLSLPGTDEHGGPLPIPGFGAQLQDVAVFGKQAEAKVDIQYTYENIVLPGGQVVELRKPTYTLLNPSCLINHHCKSSALKNTLTKLPCKKNRMAHTKHCCLNAHTSITR
jgi:CxxC motif-containing protein (DUF1111 family)